MTGKPQPPCPDGSVALPQTAEASADRRFRTEDRIIRPDKPAPPSIIARLLGKRAEAVTPPPLPASSQAGETSGSIFARIGAFLDRNGLEPTPDHYAVAWEYFVAPHSALGWAVDRAIEAEGGLSAATAEVLLSQHRTKMSAENLNDMIGEAQAYIADGSQLVAKSHADAKAYGTALKTEMSGMADGNDIPSTVAALTQLTQSMVHKTAEAEKQLRNAVKQMADMQGRLATAEKLAESDALTGLANRRAFERTLRRSVAVCRESGQPLSVAFCDIDHFKKVNDMHGHATGDRVLKYVANLLSRISNGNCHVARHGGEEFVILLKGRTADEAHAIVDRARADLCSRTLAARDTEAPIGKISFSAGIAQLEPGGNGSDLLHRADRALYRAKKEGRNRVCI